MAYSKQLQAAHRTATPSWTVPWFKRKGARWFRVVVAVHHFEGLTRLREFGRRRSE